MSHNWPRILGQPKEVFLGEPSTSRLIKHFVDNSPFKRLPFEVMEHLFSFLSKNDLKEVELVNKHFSGVVVNSLKLTIHLTLHIDGFNAYDLIDIRRKYKKLNFTRVDRDWFKRVEPVLSKIGQHVTKVTKFTMTDWNYRTHCNPVLKHFPNLEELAVAGYLFDEQPSMFAKLKDLRLFNVAHKDGLFCNVKNLKRLQIHCRSDTWDHVIETLKSLKAVELLILDVKTGPGIFGDPLLENLRPDLRVRRLFISSEVSTDFLHGVAMLFGHRVLGSLSLDGDSWNCYEKFGRLLDNFSSVTALRIHCLGIPNYETFYRTATVNRHLTDLVLFGTQSSHFENVTGLLGLFKIFPNIQNLTLPFTTTDRLLTPKDIDRINEKLDQLKSLTVGVSTPSSLSHFMPILRNMTALHVYSLDYWTDNGFEVVAKCPKLQILNILKDSRHSIHFEDLIDTFSNLKTLIYSQGLEVQHLKIIMEKAKKLQTFKTNKSCWVHDEHMELAFNYLRAAGIDVVISEATIDEFFRSQFSQQSIFKVD